MNIHRLAMCSLLGKRCLQNQLRFVNQQQKEVQQIKNSKEIIHLFLKNKELGIHNFKFL